MNHTLPSRRQALWFALKVNAHRAIRCVKNICDPSVKPGTFSEHRQFSSVVGESVVPLWNPNVDSCEFPLEAGRVENLRMARQKLHGREFAPNQIFSFWQHIGPPWQLFGFVEGREIREGCIIPAIAGGICLLSNTLYEAACQASFEIVERHRRIIPGSFAASDRNATVFWNYFDLRFRSSAGFRLEIDLDQTCLKVRIYGQPSASKQKVARQLHLLPESRKLALNNCYSCE